MNITIDQIKCLRAVYDEGSITKAAEKLYRAKSAVNYSLKTLEEQVGVKLLDKKGYRPKLTSKGEEFLFKSQTLLNEHDELLESTKSIRSGIEMKLSLSISYNCSPDKLYNVIKKAMSKFPSTQLSLVKEVLSGETFLKNEVVDIALYEDIGTPVDFEYMKLGAFSLPIYISSNHPFVNLPKKEQTLKNLKKHPHIIISTTFGESDISRAVEDDDLKWYVSDIYSKVDLISKGLGWGRVPSHFIGNKKLTHLKHLDDLRKIDYFVCRRKDKNHGEVSQFIWDSLK
jgi:DNA-binding transcriptional LysR family regulator